MSQYIRKPSLRKTAPVRRLIGASAVGSKKSGMVRKIRQQQRLGGYWTKKNGRDVFVLSTKATSADDRLARTKDRIKKKVLGR